MFQPDDLALSVDTIGGDSIRIHFYDTTDAESAVTAADYFTNATRRGIRLGDIIVVRTSGSTFLSGVVAISAAGHAQISVDRNLITEYATVAAAQAASIPPIVYAVRTQAYATGDRGGALYKRVASQPSHAAKVQDATGTWFEFAEPVIWAAQVGGNIATARTVATALGILVGDDFATATQAEAEAGTSNLRSISPLRALQAIQKAPAFVDTLSTKGRSVVEVISDFSHSIVNYNGVFLDGVTSDTAGIQLAANNQRAIFIPPNKNVRATGTVTLPAGCILEGGGYSATRWQRVGVWAGDTVVASGDAQIRGILFEQLHPGFVAGVSTTMVDRLTADQSHITLQDSSGAIIENCWVSFGVYGIKLLSTTRASIRDIFSSGSWDAQNGNLCEMKAVIYLGSTAGRPYNTDPTIERFYIGGGNTCVTRSITIGTTSFSTNLGAGCQDAILIEGLEGGHIKSGYMAANRGGVRVAPTSTSICRDFSLDDIFVDAPSEDGFYFGTNGGSAIAGVHVTKNRFNGQTIARRAVTIDAVGGVPNLIGAVFADNLSYNHLLTPFQFFGAKAVGFKNNIVNNYHCRAGGPGNAGFSAGLLVGSGSSYVEARDNFYGGGANDWSGTNNCQYGEVFATGSGRTGGTTGIFGLSGGAIVSGVTPLY